MNVSRAPFAPLLGIGLIAFGTLLLEVDLTRVFAVTLWYYFGFVSISLALLGIGAAGVLCYVDRERWTGEDYRNHMGRFSIELGILCPLVMWIHLVSDFSAISVHQGWFFAILGLNLIGFFFLFFLAGMIIAIGLFRFRDEVGRFYFYDLAGASLGSLAVIALLYHFSAPALAFAFSAACFLAAFLFLAPHVTLPKKAALLLLAVAALILTTANDDLGLLKIATVKSYDARGVQSTERAKVFEKWSPVSRVVVFPPGVSSAGRERMRVTNDAGAPTTLYKFDGDWSSADWVLGAPTNIALHLRPNGESLVIGPGGGMDVLSGLRFGNRRITAVEINPVMAELVTEHFPDYIGHIFHDPRVTLHVREGRNFAAGATDSYDVITITMIDSWAGAAAGAYMFSENTLYTYEAIRDYYERLDDDGILSITRYFPWDEALRVVNTYLAYLSDIGVRQPQGQIMAVIEPDRRFRQATLLLRRDPFTPEEVHAVAELASQHGYSILYAPRPVPSDSLEGGDQAEFFRTIVESTPEERKRLLNSYGRNVAPSTDDRPFFFFMDRFRDMFNPDLTEHPARRLAMPILYFVFLLFAMLAVLTMFVPLWMRRDLAMANVEGRTGLMAYFAGIGIGFMLIEISLIHRLTVFLGHPTYSFVVVLFSILLASGIGSLISERLRVSRLPLILAAIVAITGLTATVIYDQLSSLMWLGLPQRVLVSIVMLFPIGFLLGMCFPLGIRWMRRAGDNLIPWAWAVNCVFSVFAAAASLVVAINFGLKAMILAGATCYLANLLIVMRHPSLGLGKARVVIPSGSTG